MFVDLVGKLTSTFSYCEVETAPLSLNVNTTGLNFLLTYIINTAIRKGNNRHFLLCELSYIKRAAKRERLIELTDMYRSSLAIFHIKPSPLLQINV
jgi:hypothetical protein